MMKKHTLKYSALAALVCLSLGAGIVFAEETAPTQPKNTAETKKDAPSGETPAELHGDVVEYSTVTNVVMAKGNVVLKKDGATMKGNTGTYNTKTEFGTMTGNVIIDKDDMHMTADIVTAEKQNYFLALGNVHAKQQDKTFDGEKAEYTADKDYVRMEKGGTIGSADGTFYADYMEGWVKPEHIIGRGHAHIKSPARQFEGGGDHAEYFGKESGKAVLTGNAWAVQEGNSLKSNKLIVFLSDEQKLTAVEAPEEKPQERAQTDNRTAEEVKSSTETAKKEAEEAKKEADIATKEAKAVTGEKASEEKPIPKAPSRQER